MSDKEVGNTPLGEANPDQLSYVEQAASYFDQFEESSLQILTILRRLKILAEIAQTTHSSTLSEQ